jgi:hypothetical protein
MLAVVYEILLSGEERAPVAEQSVVIHDRRALAILQDESESELLRATILIFQLSSWAPNQGTACREPAGTILWRWCLQPRLLGNLLAGESMKTAAQSSGYGCGSSGDFVGRCGAFAKLVRV